MYVSVDRQRDNAAAWTSAVTSLIIIIITGRRQTGYRRCTVSTCLCCSSDAFSPVSITSSLPGDDYVTCRQTYQRRSHITGNTVATYTIDSIVKYLLHDIDILKNSFSPFKLTNFGVKFGKANRSALEQIFTRDSAVAE